MKPEFFGERERWVKVALLVSFLLFLINLLFLDIDFFKKAREATFTGSAIEESQAELVTPTPQPTEMNTCPLSCLEAITEATAAGLTSATPTVKPSTTGTTVKEFFISLGGGSTRAGDWEDMLGLEAYIDSSKYSNLKEVVFEAAMSIPNGNQKAHARLYNVTDGHMVWNSEVWLEGGTPQLLISGPLTLSPGRKLYRVQMKTQIRDLAVLSQARIKITTN